MARESLRRRCSWLEWPWGSHALANKPREEGLVIRCIHPAPTHRSYCILVSKCVSSSQPHQYGLHFPGGTKASIRDVSSGWSKEAMQDQQRPQTWSPMFPCSFSLLPHMTRHGVFAWMGTPLILHIFPPPSTYTWNGILKTWHFYFWTVECLVHKIITEK